MSIIIALIILVAIISLLNRGQPSRSWRGKIYSFPRQNAGGVKAETRRKLLKLLGNNTATANRLIHQAKLKRPGKSEQWYWEKVLYDLERDRCL